MRTVQQEMTENLKTELKQLLLFLALKWQLLERSPVWNRRARAQANSKGGYSELRDTWGAQGKCVREVRIALSPC